MTRVLVTGATGYVGGRLVAHLAHDPGVWVRALVRSPSGAEGVTADDVAQGDLAGDTFDVTRACDGIDTIVHLAGPNELVAAEQPDRALRETIIGSRRLADAAQRTGVGRIIYVSTVHVYGARLATGTTVSEEQNVVPDAPYAIARLASEHLLAAAGAQGIEVVVFRLTNSVGAPASPALDRWSLVTNDLSRQAVTTGCLRLRTSGAQWRDFVPLADVCRVLAGCLPAGSLAPGTYNLASGTPRTVRQLAGMIQDACEGAGLPRPALFAPEPPACPPPAVQVSTVRLAAAGWRLETPLDEAVAETVEFCVAHCSPGEHSNRRKA